MNIKGTIIGVAIGATLTVATVAFGSTKPEAHVGLSSTVGPNAINPQTCKFLHPERDVVLNLGTLTQKLNENGRYDVAEDARHDAFNACVRNWIKQHQKPTLGPTFSYKTAYATGTGQRVTAQCPAGYYVTGGGSHSETTGSYPEGNDAWTVVRDHLSPRVLDSTAICVRFS